MTTKPVTMDQITHLIPTGKHQGLHADMLAYVVKSGPCTRKVLLAMFGDMPATPANTKHIDNIIRVLSDKGLLVNVAKAGMNLWVVGDGSNAILRPHQLRTPSKTRSKCTVLEDADAGLVITPPRRIDVMGGALYRPGPSVCPRAGAMDYRSIPSRGFRC